MASPLQYPNDQMKQKWEPILQWLPNVRQAQQRVLADEGQMPPGTRILAHMQIEDPQGKPGIPSRGVNDTSYCKPCDTCSCDGHAYGLMQVFWPGFTPVDWNRLKSSDPGDASYQIYAGGRTLALKYKQCGNWVDASHAFFSGSCQLDNTTDDSTGTSARQYAAAMDKNLRELADLGISDTGGADPDTGNPKGNNHSGNGGSSGGNDKPPAVSVNPVQVAANLIGAISKPAVIILVGLVIAAIALYRVVN